MRTTWSTSRTADRHRSDRQNGRAQSLADQGDSSGHFITSRSRPGSAQSSVIGMAGIALSVENRLLPASSGDRPDGPRAAPPAGSGNAGDREKRRSEQRGFGGAEYDTHGGLGFEETLRSLNSRPTRRPISPTENRRRGGATRIPWAELLEHWEAPRSPLATTILSGRSCSRVTRSLQQISREGNHDSRIRRRLAARAHLSPPSV